MGPSARAAGAVGQDAWAREPFVTTGFTVSARTQGAGWRLTAAITDR
jgi:hypothetical protein